jgi:hypothetical protein
MELGSVSLKDDGKNYLEMEVVFCITAFLCIMELGSDSLKDYGKNYLEMEVVLCITDFLSFSFDHVTWWNCLIKDMFKSLL